MQQRKKHLSEVRKILLLRISLLRTYLSLKNAKKEKELNELLCMQRKRRKMFWQLKIIQFKTHQILQKNKQSGEEKEEKEFPSTLIEAMSKRREGMELAVASRLLL